MRRIAPALLAATLPLSLLAFAPAAVEEPAPNDGTPSEEEVPEEAEPIVPDPVEFVFHLHGDEEVAYTDDEVYATSGNQTMDTAPAEGDFQSRQFLNYVGGPNSACSDNALFPTWTGFVGEGTITSDATLRIDVAGSLGGTVEVRLWTDTGGGCNEANVPPHAVTTANLPIGTGSFEVAIPAGGLDPTFELKVMLVPTSPDAQARLLYDGADYDATLSFTCQPDAVETAEAAAEADCLPF